MISIIGRHIFSSSTSDGVPRANMDSHWWMMKVNDNRVKEVNAGWGTGVVLSSKGRNFN